MVLAQNAIRDAAVVAPLAGVVAKRHVQPGEKVAFDAPILTIVDLRELELAALVPAVDVPELEVGLAVELTVEGFGERKFSGRIVVPLPFPVDAAGPSQGGRHFHTR